MKFLQTLWCLGFVVVLAGCKEEGIKVYRVSKELAPSAPEAAHAAHSHDAMDSAPSAPAQTAQGSATFESPANWEAQPLAAMREASFVVKGEAGTLADVSLIILRGVAGTDLSNVNRWLGQLGKPPITEEELAKFATTETTELGKVMIVEIEGTPQGGDGTKDGKILAGIVAREGATWFFKIRGNVQLVNAEREHFLDWVRSSRPAAEPTTSPAASPSTSDATQPPIQWEVPKDWKSVPPSQMRYASFLVENGNGEKAEVTVVSLPGESGGELANINRWRNQVGLEPVAEPELKTLVTRFGDDTCCMASIDLKGPSGRMIAGWLQKADQSWFFKFTGPSSLIDGEKEKFLGFLRSVKFGDKCASCGQT